jgi:preprotein translocase subunit SecD
MKIAQHGSIALTLVAGASALAPTHQDASAATPRPRSLLLAVDWERVGELGLDAGAAPEARSAALHDLLVWRLGASGLAAKVDVQGGRVLVESEQALTAEENAAFGRMLEQLGQLEFLVVADGEDPALGLAAETARFEAWRGEHRDAPLSTYNAAPERAQPRIAWLAARERDTAYPPRPVELPASPTLAFGSVDFARVEPSQGGFGDPALAFELVPERVAAFRAFTRENRRRQLAIVVDGVIRSVPVLHSELAGKGVVEGRFSEEEVREMAARLRSPGPLRVVESG